MLLLIRVAGSGIDELATLLLHTDTERRNLDAISGTQGAVCSQIWKVDIPTLGFILLGSVTDAIVGSLKLNGAGRKLGIYPLFAVWSDGWLL